MSRESFPIPVDGLGVDSLSAILQRAEGDGEPFAVLLAHGAGAPMDCEFMEDMACGLVEEGFDVLRFSYAYMERAKREGRRFPPDRQPKLEAAHHAALACLRQRIPSKPAVMAGKSMGGRISSLLSAAGVPCAGLIYLGYPLHPQGKPDKLRTEHFPRISAPSLFLQGTRDALCDLKLLDQALVHYGADWQRVLIDGGDHSFDLPKRLGISSREVHDHLVQAMATWLRELASRPQS